jgi:hypothetical protein
VIYINLKLCQKYNDLKEETMKKVTRREILAKGLITGVTVAAGGLTFFEVPRKYKNLGLKKIFDFRIRTSSALVKSLKGNVTANRILLKPGDRVPGGIQLLVEKGSQIIFSLPDKSVLKIKGRTKMDLSAALDKNGTFRRVAGSLPVKNSHIPAQYIVQGSTAAVSCQGRECSFSLNFVI